MAGNSDDTSRATITLGDRNNTGTANTQGRMLLNGYPVDIKAGTLTIGQDNSSSTANLHGGIGVLQFDTGTVDATTVNIALYYSTDCRCFRERHAYRRRQRHASGRQRRPLTGKPNRRERDQPFRWLPHYLRQRRLLRQHRQID